MRLFSLNRDFDLLRRTLVDFNLSLAGARSASRCARYAKSHRGHSSTGCNIYICDERRAVMSLQFTWSDGRNDGAA